MPAAGSTPAILERREVNLITIGSLGRPRSQVHRQLRGAEGFDHEVIHDDHIGVIQTGIADPANGDRRRHATL
jgi:hypothetical protein